MTSPSAAALEAARAILGARGPHHALATLIDERTQHNPTAGWRIASDAHEAAARDARAPTTKLLHAARAALCRAYTTRALLAPNEAAW